MAGLEGLSAEQAGQWLRVAWYLVLLAFHRRERAEYAVLQALILEEARGSKFRVQEEGAAMGQTMAEYVRQEGEARGEARGLRRALGKNVRAAAGAGERRDRSG